MNLVLIAPPELRLAEGGLVGYVELSPHDRRAIHLVKVLKVTPGKAINVGLLNSSMVEAVVERVDDSPPEHTVPLPDGQVAPPPSKPKQAGQVGKFITLSIKSPPLEGSAPKPHPRGLAPFDLVVGLPRPKVFHSILVNATSMGVGRIFFVHCAKSEKGYLSSKSMRAQAIMEGLLEGLEQGRDTILPEVYVYASWTRFEREMLSRPQFAQGPSRQLRLVAHPYAEDFVKEGKTFSPNLQGMCQEVSKHCQKDPNASVMLAIGPEGGFIPEEVHALRDNLGFDGVGLGTRILKVEVALYLLQGAISDAMAMTDVMSGQGWGSGDRRRVPEAGLTQQKYRTELLTEGFCTKNSLLQASIGVESDMDGNQDQLERMKKVTDPSSAHNKAVLEGMTVLQLPSRNWKAQIDQIRTRDEKGENKRNM